MASALTQLRGRLAELSDLRNTAQLLEWDQQTMMPPHGASSRAESLATIERIAHDLFISEDTGKLIERAAGELDGADPDSDQARLVQVARRRWQKARRVPTELAAELARAASIGHRAWETARANSDFGSFAPYLEHNLELSRRYVDCFDEFECRYDAVLDDFEPYMTTRQIRALFDELKSELAPLIATLGEHGQDVDGSWLNGQFPIDRQRHLVADVISLMGFDPSAWRLDDTVHPFATGIGTGDVRITTRWDESFFPSSLYGAMHECGHGLYEEGISPSLRRTPLGYAESLGLHESQSRLWENMVGRGRAFCTVLAPRINALFDAAAAGKDAEALYRAVNRVEPSLIRVEADEATYGLHIVMRFELEQELIEGRLAVSDLPDAWNRRVEEYLGLEVPDDAHGVLQDVHWSGGLIGYFPTYALGNLIAGQLWERALVELPELEAQIARGELLSLREWLRENVHKYGSKFPTAELMERVVGGPIAVAPFISYLKRKLGDVYGLPL